MHKVTVSFGAVLAVIIPAFSPFARAAAGSALRYAAARAATAAPLYRFWLGRGWSSVRLRARAGAAVRDMKHAVREAMRRQRLEESEIRDGVRKGAPPAVGGLFGPRPRRRRGMSRGGGGWCLTPRWEGESEPLPRSWVLMWRIPSYHARGFLGEVDGMTWPADLFPHRRLWIMHALIHLSL